MTRLSDNAEPVDGAVESGSESALSSTVIDTLHGLLDELGSHPRTISPAADLERDLGLGSLERVELIIRLEERLAVKLPDTALTNGQTPALLIAALRSAGARPASARRVDVESPSVRAPARWGIPSSITTLVELARYRAEAEGDRTHLFLPDDDGGERQLSFAAVWSGGLRVAAGLAALGVKPGDRVAIILPTGPAFYPTFLGILIAGCVPVPLYPPVRLDDLPAYIEREMNILASAQASVLVTDRQLLSIGKLIRDRNPALIAVASDELDRDSSFGVARVRPQDLALIQYSSGSTGDPKGVALSHESLIANMRAIGAGLAFGPTDVPVSWLPLYHDMGLIGTWLSPYLHGMQVVMISPLSFLMRPERWLWAFHRYRGSISPAPNFGYDLCCRKIRDADIEGLDLSSWRSAMNGSEPVRAATVERFCRRFGPYGFRREAMMPVYGLAETSVALTFPPLERGPRFDRVDAEVFAREGRAVPSPSGTMEFASCGPPLAGHEVRVVDERNADVEERVQGRILFRGPSSMSGYFNRPDATAAVRRGEWIDSGDLGYLVEGELHVTGRLKDLIIKGGRKYHPQDVEEAVHAVDGLRKGCAVAFDVAVDIEGELNGEAIVLLAESREPAAHHPAITAAIIAAVQDHIGTPPDRVLLLPPGSLPKTSSGKLKRRQSRTMYIEGAFARRRSTGLAMARLAAESLMRRAQFVGRALWRWLFGVYATTMTAATLIPGFAAVSLVCRSRASAWRGGRLVLRAGTTLAGLPVHRSGPAIPAGGAILVSNHASNLDWGVLMLALEQPFLFTAKASVFTLPILGRIAERLGHIKVERNRLAGRQQGYQDALAAVRLGRLVHFFPEATFTAASGLRPFRLGAFQLAAETGLPIIPVAICGTRQALRDGEKWLSRARIEVRVLPAVAPPAIDLGEIARTRDLVREQLAREAGEPVLDIVTAALPPEAELTS